MIVILNQFGDILILILNHFQSAVLF